MAGRGTLWMGMAVAGSVMAGCALLSPLPGPAGLTERLAVFPTGGLPLHGAVTIHWNAHHIPFIEAETDEDAAFALGLVHAHLRLGQMAMARMLAYGRVSEMAGPVALDIDRGLRVLSFSRAAAASERAMDPAARRWTQRFVDGINHYQDAVRVLPHEFRVLGLAREPWTVADVLTIGRLVGTDVNWMVWARLLPLRTRTDWPELWARMVNTGSASLPSFGGSRQEAALDTLLEVGRSGSNSMALAPARTATGGALIANDPHLGLMVPNVWLIAGVKSPSFHAVGLMGPGLPIFAIGRNRHIAWGGTNMRAASSDLYDMSTAAPDITERHEKIRVRWWFDTEITVRDTVHGPIITDTPLLAGLDLPPLALKWTGHRPSDEISAMLAVSRAQDFREFHRAFHSFSVPGQNMLYADAKGNIGQVMAAHLPRRNGAPGDIFHDPAVQDPAWAALYTAGDLPFSYNPGAGYLVSANNRPTADGPPVGFFFSPDDRVQRMAEVIEAETPVGLETLIALQQDVKMPSALALRDLFIARLDTLGLGEPDDAAQAEAVERLRGWDGHYRPESKGAVVFEQFRAGFTGIFYPQAFGETDWQAFANFGRAAVLLQEDVDAADPAVLRRALTAGLESAAQGAQTFQNWAEMHRLQLGHALAMAPVIGSRYRFAEYGVGGSSDTLLKTAHDTTTERHRVRYGANARHVSDMTDPDANYFVLLGGQDGWLNSSTLLDQWPLWRDGRYVQVPLTPEKVHETFPHKLVLKK